MIKKLITYILNFSCRNEPTHHLPRTIIFNPRDRFRSPQSMVVSGFRISRFQLRYPIQVNPSLRTTKIFPKLIFSRPENTIFTGLEVTEDRIFLAMPRLRVGVPATLATIPRKSPAGSSPPLRPYPDWSFHGAGTGNNNCSGLISVYRIRLDSCNRLWVSIFFREKAFESSLYSMIGFRFGDHDLHRRFHASLQSEIVNHRSGHRYRRQTSHLS